MSAFFFTRGHSVKKNSHVEKLMYTGKDTLNE